MLHDLQQLAEYEDNAVQDEAVEPVAEFDEDDDDAPTETVSESSNELPMVPPSRRSSTGLEDTSVPIPHSKSTLRSPNSFSRLVFGAKTLLCQDPVILAYEILRMLEQNTEISKLPESLATLKRWTKAQISLLQLRKKSIPLQPAILASMKASSKLSTDTPSEDLYFSIQNIYSNSWASSI